MLGAEFQEENLLPFLKSVTMIMEESVLLSDGGWWRQDWFSEKRMGTGDVKVESIDYFLRSLTVQVI